MGSARPGGSQPGRPQATAAGRRPFRYSGGRRSLHRPALGSQVFALKLRAVLMNELTARMCVGVQQDPSFVVARVRPRPRASGWDQDPATAPLCRSDIRRILCHEMQRLDAPDVGRVGRFLVEAEEIDGDEPFPPELLAALRRIVPCDCVLFDELDRVAQVRLGLTSYPAGENAAVVTYWDIRHEHPVCSHQEATGDWRSARLTDFVTRGQLRRSRIYADWFHPNGIEHELAFGLDSPLTHTKVFLFERPRGRDFSGSDKAVLDVLRPFLTRRYRTSRARHRLHAVTSLVEQAGIPLIFLDEHVVSSATTAASRLLALGLDRGQVRLPEEIVAWLDASQQAGTNGELSYDTDGRSLVIRLLADGVLLVDERGHCSTLTPREREILELVADGDTNGQIADRLWISPATVRSHLENIYAKLGVHTRTAAVRALSRRPS